MSVRYRRVVEDIEKRAAATYPADGQRVWVVVRGSITLFFILLAPFASMHPVTGSGLRLREKEP